MDKILILLIIFVISISFVPQVLAEQKTTSISRLIDGWNLFTLPGFLLADRPESTAIKLIDEINRQGGQATTVAKFTGGKWQEVVKREKGQVYGQDFPIEPGMSYFVRNYKTVDYKMAVLEQATTFKLSLKPGYNFVGFPGFKKAKFKFSDLVGDINRHARQKEVLLSSFQSGLFQSFLQLNAKNYGEDQAINRFNGYVIMIDQPVDFVY